MDASSRSKGDPHRPPRVVIQRARRGNAGRRSQDLHLPEGGGALLGEGEAGCPLRGRWTGSHVVCIASGPSLTADQCEQVRKWRQEETQEQEKRRVIVVNTTYQIALWADAL